MKAELIEHLCEGISWAEIDEEFGESRSVYCSTESDLNAIETFLNRELPNDYRWFMKNYGMCEIEDERVHITLNGVSLSFLAAFKSADQALVLTQMLSENGPDKRIPDESLIIADSISGDFLVMDLSNTRFGFIYFLSNLKPWGAFEDSDYLVLIAKSLTDLLLKIVENDSPEEPDFNIPEDMIR
ncbi:SMI1 / KNR4 family protein [Grimontia celer]|uniref:SMI1 / KNR4 family protein n=1 Tax=Grimontia celer TaxID=1796497 RepID=A0A128F1M2_9GAMM|nr:SMI1/KNR4 family protein [Grimontia celer]CZF80679.1 SMI1 / KNR4 family protein [Grimontia celer]